MKKAIFNWSGGKDSAIALYKVMEHKIADVHQLVTTVNQDQNRISMHGVRTSLLDAQAASIGLPLNKILLPENPSMDVYNKVMKEMLIEYKSMGISNSIFGDIFLEDLRDYRDSKLAEVGFSGIYPLWKISSEKIMKTFLELGFRSVVVCINSNSLDESFIGREIDQEFINDLPEGVDVCGENGEYHSFVYDGPIFKSPISFEFGETVFKQFDASTSKGNSYDTGFWYIDIF